MKKTCLIVATLLMCASDGPGVPGGGGFVICEEGNVCLFCPCPWDYYNEPGDGIGDRNGVVDVNDLLFLLENWGMPAQVIGNCLPPEDQYDVINVRVLVDLISNWGGCG